MRIFAALALASFSFPAVGAPPILPLDVKVTNTTANPVPVSIVAAALPTTINCRLNLGQSFASTPIFQTVYNGADVAALQCPAGVNSIRVRRVIFDPTGGSLPSENLVHFRMLVALGDSTNVIAIVTDGSPEAKLAAPILIDRTSGQEILYKTLCSSGIAGINVKCGGQLLLFGSAAD